MPFYPVAPKGLVDAYVALAKEHNDPATPPYQRKINYWKSTGMLEAVNLIYGSTTAGMMIMDADSAMPDDGRPMCGGFLLEVALNPPAPALTKDDRWLS